MMAMEMDRMIGHGEITHAHAHPVAEPRRHRIDAGKHPAVPRPHVEIGHLGNLRQREPGSIKYALMMKTKSRSTRRNFASRGCTTNMPIMPIAICTISSECG